MSISIFCLSGLLCITACAINKQNHLKAVSTVEFNLLDTTSRPSLFDYYNLGGNEYFCNYSKKNYAINMYDFKSQKFLYSIKLSDTLFATGIDGYYIKSLDSVFVNIRYVNIVALMNREGKIIDSWNIKDSLIYNKDYELFVEANDKLYVHNNKLYISKMPAVEYSMIPYTCPVIVYDLVNRKILKNTGAFPGKYKKGESWHLVGYSINKILTGKGNLVISYPVSDELYCYNSNDSLVSTISIPSGYLEKYSFPPFDVQKRGDAAYKVSYVAELGMYYNLIYDPYREVYYRVVLHPQKFRNEDRTSNNYNDRAWSIMVIDKNFHLLSENYFEARKYRFSYVIVTSKGLLISNDHELNPNTDAKKLSFTLFELQ